MEHSSRFRLNQKGPFTICAAIVLMLATAAPAQQDEGSTYFSLSSDRAVRPGETVQVRVNVTGVAKLHFRLYRVQDPVKFFGELPDPHHFGGRFTAAKTPRTLLERFARWRRDLRSDLRNFVRAQFSPGQRTEIRARMKKPTGTPAPSIKQSDPNIPAEYANIPILNSQQVVMVWEQPLSKTNRWEASTVPVHVRDKGVYVLEATDGKLRAYTLISVTDLAIITKAARRQLAVRLVNRVSGEPIDGGRVTLLHPGDSHVVAEGQTANGGIWSAQPPEPGSGGLVVVIKTRDDFAAAPVEEYALGTEDNAPVTGTVYTERPIYRPGNDVHFKAIARTDSNDGFVLPKDRQAEFEVTTPDGETLLKNKLNVSNMGTASGTVKLATGAATGYYSIRAKVDGGTLFGGFNVEEYRKPEFEVRVSAAEPRVRQGQAVQLTVDARYYYGEPVRQGKVHWTAKHNRHWSWFDPDDEDTFGGGADVEGQGEGGDQAREGTITLDDAGRAVINISPTRARFDENWWIEAEVTDTTGRMVSGAGGFLATQGNYQLQVNPTSYVSQPGQPAGIEVRTVDYDGNPVANVTFNALLESVNQQGGRQRIDQANGTTGADGKAAVSLTPPKGGLYSVTVTSSGGGSTVIDDTSLWVSGNGAWESQEERIQLVPDKRSYAPGETAHVLIATGVPKANVWISIECTGVLWTKLVRMDAPAQTVDIPVAANWAPNVFVDAVFIENSKLHRGTRMLKVPAVTKKLNVAIQPNQPQFEPGQPATYQVRTTDNQGRPVAAEVSLGVVDEAIYAIRKERGQDAYDVFYGRRWNRVQTESSLFYYFFGEAGQRAMPLARLRSTTAHAQLKPNRMAQPRIRKAFPDTAFWLADLKTNGDGNGQVRFNFPDALTTWRATAIGVTGDTKIGQSIQKTLVRKNVVFTMAPPRFFTQGDEVIVPVAVRNYLPESKRVQLSLDVKGATIVKGSAAAVEVASNGEHRVDFRLRIDDPNQVELLGKALTDVESDAMQLTIPVHPFGVPYQAAQTGVIGGDQTIHAQPRFEESATPQSRMLEVQLTPSASAAVFGALDYLITYPYGCTEQTMSSFLPNIIVSQAVNRLKIPAQMDEADLQRKVRAGLERLYDFQHDDGGWGWWKSDDSDVFMTAYVAAGLQMAKDAGYKVEGYRIENAATAVRKQFGKIEKGRSLDLIAWQLYTLAQLRQAREKDFELVWQQSPEFSPLGYALFGLAAVKANNHRLTDAIDHLEKMAVTTNDEVSWPAKRDLMLDFETDATPEATAYALKLLVAAKPGSHLVDGAARWLLAHRREGYYWDNTKRTAMVIYGLVDYLERSKELKPDFQARVTVNGKEVLNRTFGANDVFLAGPVSFRLPVGTDPANVTIEKHGAGKLYWSLISSMQLGTDRVMLPPSAQMNVRREYFRLRSNGRGYSMEPLSGNVESGDLIAVKLRAYAPGSKYVLIVDPLPAGAEAIQREDLLDIQGRSRSWLYWAERREIRDSQVSFLQSEIPKEGADLFYVMRITNGGTFRVSPPRIELMYQPGVVSAGDQKTLEVRQ